MRKVLRALLGLLILGLLAFGGWVGSVALDLPEVADLRRSIDSNLAARGSRYVPYDCRSGTCTTCMQFQLEGEMDQDLAFALDDDDLEQGWRLICIGSPLSDCVLDA